MSHRANAADIPRKCVTTFKLEPHHDCPHLSYLSIRTTHPIHGELASGCATIVRRTETEDLFHSILYEESVELATFSERLFDKFGRLRPLYVEDAHHRGTGCWGHEMSQGDILYIVDITVKEKYRGIGIGSKLLESLFASKHAQDKWLFCYPLQNRALHTETTFREDLETTPQYDNFFRKNGFRRVGRSYYLARAPNASHASRLLPRAVDIPYPPDVQYYKNHPESITDDDVPRDTDTRSSEPYDRITRRAIREFPVHSAIRDLRDTMTQVMEAARARYPTSDTVEDASQDIAQVIASAHAKDPASINAKDRNGWTPLFIAAHEGKVDAVRTLLQLGATAALWDRDNVDGYTPLEICRERMEVDRTRSESGRTLFMSMMVRKPEWVGFKTEYLRIEYLLLQRMGVAAALQAASEDEYVEKNRWGCTCGQCVDGWLPPQMATRLSVQALSHYMILKEDYTGFGPCQFLPRALQAPWPINTFVTGYRLIFYSIYHLLMRRAIPAIEEIFWNLERGYLGEWIPQDRGRLTTADERAVDHFLGTGGRVQFALDSVTFCARMSSPILGNGSLDGHMNATTDDDGPEAVALAHMWRGLPRCRNDLEFTVVRTNLGLDEGRKWGPYYEGCDGDPRPGYMERRGLGPDAGVESNDDEDCRTQ